MTDYDYDLFVIGGGSGGVRGARIAAGTGAKVAIAEEFRYGGTCVIRGCVPKKLMVYASHYGEDFHEAEGFGWTVTGAKHDWKKLIANKDTEITRLEAIYAANLDKAGVEILRSRAVLEDAHTIRLVAEDRTVTADKILIATGGTPFKPEDVPGVLHHTITSNEVFDLKEMPKRVLVVGGGYIAVEFAGIFNGLGAETALIYRGEEVLRGFDDDVRNHLHQEMLKKGINVHCNTTIAHIEESGDHYEIKFGDGALVKADVILYATGRNPNSAGMGLENAGVELSHKGAIKVDDYSRTNVENIWAVGDVTDRVALTPVAIHEAMCFVETAFKGNSISPDHDQIPTAVFSQPPIGTIGLTEAQAREIYADLDIYRSVFTPMKHTLSGSDEKMLMKLMIDAKTDRVVGLHILGPDSGEMIQCLGVAVKMGATKADFDRTMAVHPTASEELVTLSTPDEVVRGGETVEG